MFSIKQLSSSLKVREEYLSKSIEVLGKDSKFLRKPYNDLGMTYLFLFDLDPSNSEYLDMCQIYLISSYEISLKIFGNGGLSIASAQTNLSSLLERKRKYEAALDMAKSALQTRRDVYSDNGSRTYCVLIDVFPIYIYHSSSRRAKQITMQSPYLILINHCKLRNFCTVKIKQTTKSIQLKNKIVSALNT